MDIICIEENAFYALVENVIAAIKEKQNNRADKWISGREAMKLLRIKSKTTLQKLRDEGKIRFSQPGRIVLYDRDSIIDYLEDRLRDISNAVASMCPMCGLLFFSPP